MKSTLVSAFLFIGFYYYPSHLIGQPKKPNICENCFWVERTKKIIKGAEIIIPGHWSKIKLEYTQQNMVNTKKLNDMQAAALKIKWSDRRLPRANIPFKTTPTINTENFKEGTFLNDFRVSNEKPMKATLMTATDAKVIYYFSKLELGEIIVSADMDYIFVVDTLVCYPESNISAVSPTVKNRKPTFWLVANVIQQKGNLTVKLNGLKKTCFTSRVVDNGNFYYSIKSTDELKQFIVRSNTRDGGTVQMVALDSPQEILINNNFTLCMDNALAVVNATEDGSLMQDAAIEIFKRYRVGTTINFLTEETRSRYNALCSTFDEKHFDDYTSRCVKGRFLLIDRFQPPTKYYLLPQTASVTTRSDASGRAKLGTYFFPAIGNGRKWLECSLVIKDKNELKKFENYPLSSGLPFFISLKEQKVKLKNTETISTIVPISNNSFYISLEDPSPIDVADIFPLIGFQEMRLDFTLQKELIAEPLTIEFDKEVLGSHYDFSDFSCFISENYEQALRKIEVNLDVSFYREDREGCFKNFEGTLKVRYKSGTVVSQQITLGSESLLKTFPIYLNDDYTIELIGKATYEFGERTLNFKIDEINPTFIFINDENFDG